ncbi:NAD-dependent epimerase/dehydratase family protein [Robertkochia solimangrovi]|uniref:NAD-dependent epimerase/dehydratase family protein n=1 Tax=Robertkochia solimangrovi TaxID=2213046 RepID=UPI001181441A|nr:NAD-dependent epimerase/dehydratase family protein [Robertkochia solimangrovi]TRZ42770.1 NAD-dependent epimerase [Robertkochia solimangrovi]
MERILITGAGGQLGSELTLKLSEIYGDESIIATDINEQVSSRFTNCKFAVLDVMDRPKMEALISENKVTQVYHLAAILSATGEKKPLFTWDINMQSLLNVLELAREYNLKVYWPSSIAVFGNNTPRVNTPQYCAMDPTTVYGISKLAGERWCEYYNKTYGVDVRSLRYPGLIGYKSAAGGGTTDYAVDIYRAAIAGEKFSCFLSEDTYLPMMYMPDAIKATVELMEAPEDLVKVRSSYNIGALSFSPKEIYESIKRHFPDFEIVYEPDFRQKIASSWPDSIDDSVAVSDWNWKPDFDLDTMTDDIIMNLS